MPLVAAGLPPALPLHPAACLVLTCRKPDLTALVHWGTRQQAEPLALLSPPMLVALLPPLSVLIWAGMLLAGAWE
jgi:hypothetical protein